MKTLDIDLIESYINTVRKTVGERWLNKRLKKEKVKHHSDIEGSKKGKLDYLYRPKAHQLVLWELEYARWKKVCSETKKLMMTAELIRYINLGYTLSLVQSVKGYEKVISRLKQTDQFESVSFEIEVAAGYVEKGYSVSFVTEGSYKTPDLEVILPCGQTVSVECKYKNVMTEREEKLSLIWKLIESRLLKKIKRLKLNICIVLKLSSIPENKEIDDLVEFIFGYIKSGEFNNNTEINTSIPTPCRKHQVLIKTLPDFLPENFEINFSENLDRFIFSSDRVIEDEKEIHRDPAFLGVIFEESFDNVKGVIDSFKSAAKQIPKSGPGVIIIRIDDKGWSKDLINSFKKAEKHLQKQLYGNSHKRVNAVFIKTRRLIVSEDSSEYKGFDLCVEHPSPNVKLKA